MCADSAGGCGTSLTSAVAGGGRGACSKAAAFLHLERREPKGRSSEGQGVGSAGAAGTAGAEVAVGGGATERSPGGAGRPLGRRVQAQEGRRGVAARVCRPPMEGGETRRGEPPCPQEGLGGKLR